MTVIRFTFVALPYGDPKEGTSVIHAHMSLAEKYASDATWKETPRQQMKALKDAMEFMENVVKNHDKDIADEVRMFKGTLPIPNNAKHLMWFDIKVSWKDGYPKFQDGGFERLDFDAKWNPVVSKMFYTRDTALNQLRESIKLAKKARKELELALKDEEG